MDSGSSLREGGGVGHMDIRCVGDRSAHALGRCSEVPGSVLANHGNRGSPPAGPIPMGPMRHKYGPGVDTNSIHKAHVQHERYGQCDRCMGGFVYRLETSSSPSVVTAIHKRDAHRNSGQFSHYSHLEARAQSCAGGDR
jgi:hypothetical protein